MAYDRINWINEQEGTTTPLNAENLNQMDEGIADLDGRVEELEQSGEEIPTRIEALETDNTTNKRNIATNAQAINELAEDLSGVAGAVDSKIENGYKVIKVGTKELIANGEDTITLKAGENVIISVNEETKEIEIRASGGGGGGASSWEFLSDKPFENIDNNTLINDNDTLKVNTDLLDKWFPQIQQATDTGEQSIVFTNIDTSKAYKLFFETSDGSQIGLVSSSLENTTLTYVVNIPSECPVPVNFKLRVIN